MGITILSAMLVVVANLLVGPVHALIDPRIRLE
jgi:ABC-type dipeptide/oligopeptide/nickel transport system permease component